MKPLGRVHIEWSAPFAYAIGLLVTDGSLSKDRRHISFTSKDLEQLGNLMDCLKINVKIGVNYSGSRKKCLRIQFGDKLFYKFLEKIGLMPNKSKILGVVKIPDKYFFDFLRGHFDGDGSFYSYYDPRWKSSFMFYLSFVSASKKHVYWLQQTIMRLAKVRGHITKAKNDTIFQLKYAKAETVILLKKIYYFGNIPALSRKRKKIVKAIQEEKKNNTMRGW